MKIYFFLFSILFAAYVFTACNKVSPYVPPKINSIAQHIDDSLWAYYPIAGNLNDNSGHNHTLTLSKTATLTSDKWGNENSAINFDGYTSYATIADGTSFISPNFSVSFFAMLRKSNGFFFGKQDFTTGKSAIWNVGLDNVYYGLNTRFSVTRNQDNICDQVPNGSFICIDPQPFQLYDWYHVVITFSKGVMKMYVNGNLQQSTNIPYPTLTYCSAAPFILGSYWANNQNTLDGKMDNIRIYTRELTANEVNYLYYKQFLSIVSY